MTRIICYKDDRPLGSHVTVPRVEFTSRDWRHRGAVFADAVREGGLGVRVRGGGSLRGKDVRAALAGSELVESDIFGMETLPGVSSDFFQGSRLTPLRSQMSSLPRPAIALPCDSQQWPSPH